MSETHGIRHLNKDRVLKRVIQQAGEIKSRKDTDLYLALMRAIVGQQLSIKAAATIWKRLLSLFDSGYPDAKKVARMKDDKLRSVGLSYQKAGYVKNIATFSLKNTLDYKKLKNKTDDELIEYLVQIKGVGRWTVEMILMFSLNRPDIFPNDDLGIQNGMKKLYLISASNKKELFAEMERISAAWKPYRTLACMYIWKYKDTPVGA